MLCHALQHLNWTPLYHMNSIHNQIDYFYTTLTALLDQYLPYRKVTKSTADKPWVLQQFKDLIRQRQRAFLSGNRREYSRLRNRINRMSKSPDKNIIKRKFSHSTRLTYARGGKELNNFCLPRTPTHCST